MCDRIALIFGPFSATTSAAASSVGEVDGDEFDGVWPGATATPSGSCGSTTTVEQQLGDEQAGQARVELTANPQGVAPGLGIQGDEGQLFGKQHDAETRRMGSDPEPTLRRDGPALSLRRIVRRRVGTSQHGWRCPVLGCGGDSNTSAPTSPRSISARRRRCSSPTIGRRARSCRSTPSSSSTACAMRSNSTAGRSRPDRSVRQRGRRRSCTTSAGRRSRSSGSTVRRRWMPRTQPGTTCTRFDLIHHRRIAHLTCNHLVTYRPRCGRSVQGPRRSDSAEPARRALP